MLEKYMNEKDYSQLLEEWDSYSKNLPDTFFANKEKTKEDFIDSHWRSLIRRRIRQRKIWKNLRDEIFKRDNGICQNCKCSISENEKWQIDHLEYPDDKVFENEKEYEDSYCDASKLRLLCAPCHYYLSTGNENYTDSEEAKYYARKNKIIKREEM